MILWLHEVIACATRVNLLLSLDRTDEVCLLQGGRFFQLCMLSGRVLFSVCRCFDVAGAGAFCAFGFQVLG